ncbi:hypothetical protein ACWE42_06110 [Sutcliffiella cohnii]
MLKRILIVFLFTIICFTISIVWWSTQSNVSSGIYPLNSGGSIVLTVEENIPIASFSLPVVWVKAHPWQKTPTIDKLIFRDDKGNVFSKMEGEYILQVDEDLPWYKRNIHSEVEMMINGESKVTIGERTMTSIKDSFDENYMLNSLQLQVNGMEETFSMDKTYQFTLIGNEDQVSHNRWVMNGLLGFNGTGYIFRLDGPKGDVLERILFWLPGMTENDINNMMYTFDDDFDLYSNELDEFNGEPLTLPLAMTEREILLYIPLSSEIIDELKGKIVYLLPYFQFRNQDGDLYYSGGMGSIGEFYPKTGGINLILPED